jgi:cyclophilin family peptidyl-prolyl cis-trans isomerase
MSASFSVRLGLLLVLSSCRSFSSLPISEWEDRRSLGDGALVHAALTSSEPEIRARAFLALARIQEPSTAPAIAQGLGDADAEVRVEAAFAAGILGMSWVPLPEAVSKSLVTAVLEAELREKDPEVKAALLDALGKISGELAVQRLVERLSSHPQAALALGIAFKRSGKPPAFEALTPLRAMLQRERAREERYGAAYALMQSKLKESSEALRFALEDPDWEVRAIAAKGLGDIGGEDVVPALAARLDDEAGSSSEAARALAKIAARCPAAGACLAVDALARLASRAERVKKGEGAAGMPLLAVAQQGLPVSGRPVLVSLRAAVQAALTLTAESTPVSRVSGEARAHVEGTRRAPDARIDETAGEKASASDEKARASDEKARASDEKARGTGGSGPPDTSRADLAWLDCRFAAALDRLGGNLAEITSCGAGLIPEPRRLALGLRELGQSSGGDVSARAQYLDHADPLVRTAALESVGEVATPALAQRVRELIASDDPVVAGAAASASAKLKDAEAIPALRKLAAQVPVKEEIAPPVAEALTALKAVDAEPELRTWLRSTHANVRNEAAKALTALGKSAEPGHLERAEAAEAQPLPENAALILETEEGELEVKLDTEAAPRTSAHLFALARRGFFDGLTFHRIVPNFVAQGGDPRGDGEGGPGYSVRCEVNHLRYRRGTVGMALSGKDTGGSQFFVALSAQPHLDGRYTSFGEVVRGMEHADALMEGTRILKVRAIP